MTHFDGRGNLDQVDFATLDGVPRWAGWWPSPAHTRSIRIALERLFYPIDGSPTRHLRLVVVDHGKGIRAVVAMQRAARDPSELILSRASTITAFTD